MVAVILGQHVCALFVLLDGGKRSARCLQERGEFFLDEARLFLRIAYVAEWRPHVERAAGLTFEEYVVAAQMLFCHLAARAQLLQVAVAELALLILLVADGLGVDDLFGHTWLRLLLRGRRFFRHRCGG